MCVGRGEGMGETIYGKLWKLAEGRGRKTEDRVEVRGADAGVNQCMGLFLPCVRLCQAIITNTPKVPLSLKP